MNVKVVVRCGVLASFWAVVFAAGCGDSEASGNTDGDAALSDGGSDRSGDGSSDDRSPGGDGASDVSGMDGAPVCTPCPGSGVGEMPRCIEDGCGEIACRAGYLACGEGCCPARWNGAGTADPVEPDKSPRDDVGIAPVVTVSASGIPHIVYSARGQNGSVQRHASFSGGQWNVETVLGSTAMSIADSDIVLSETEQPIVAYFWRSRSDRNNIATRVATRDDSTWNTSVVGGSADGLVGAWPSVIRDRSGRLHVAYTNRRQIFHAVGTTASGPWEVNSVDERTSGIFEMPHLVEDEAGVIHLSCGINSGREQIRYGIYKDNAWQFETPELDALRTRRSHQYNDIVVVNGVPYIFHTDSQRDGLAVISKNGDTWSREVIDNEGDTGWGVSAAVDPAGRMHVSYLAYGGTRSAVKYAVGAPGRWDLQEPEVTSAGGSYSALRTSIAIGPRGAVHIVYLTHDDNIGYISSP